MNSQNEKKSRYAVVTGASAGIGEAAAKLLAADGWHVIVAARRQEKLDAVAEAIEQAGGTATALRLDVTDQGSITNFASAVAELTGSRVDLLVNNAGGARGLEPLRETDPEDWRWMYEANVMGTLLMTRALYDCLAVAEAPQVINIVSVAGRGAYRGGAGYNAAKFGERADGRDANGVRGGWDPGLRDRPWACGHRFLAQPLQGR